MDNKKSVIALPGEEFCPADELMMNYRRYLHEESKANNYPKHIEVKNEAIKYWIKNADYYEKSDNNMLFMWDDIPEEELPPLKIKLYKQNEKWFLLYLKEYGEDNLLIQGKQRKGKNKYGSMYLDKKEESSRKR